MEAVTRVKMLMPRQSSPGSHRDASNSASSIVSTLVPVFIIATIAFFAFVFVRTKVPRVYEPRSINHLVPQHNQAKKARGGFFGWIPSMRAINDSEILKQHSLDGFLFLRFFKVMAFMSLVGCLITWPILFPVNATGGGGQQQLDILSFSNVVNANRYYAHALLAWVFQGFVVYLVTRERRFFIGLRQAYFLSPLHALRLSSRTVLFQTIPEQQCSSKRLREVFPNARKIWMVPDCKDLEELVKNRDKEWQRVEKAQVKLIQAAWKKATKGQSDRATILDGIEMPQHRLKPIIGKKVETITHSRGEMVRMDQEIETNQNQLIDGKGRLTSAAFIEFASQIEAQKAIQFAVNDKRMEWNPRRIGVQPEEVIWKNLGTSYKSRKAKMLIASIIISLMCIFWAIPVAFVGILTNVNYLTQEVPFLSFINDIPSVILGVVTGLLPTILLAVLMALVPIFCRLLAKFAGAATLTEVELKTQTWYFAFQVIQVFLVTTFTSAASAVAAQIVSNPASAVSVLAENLPKASNFYISYFILFGLMTAVMQLLNAVPLLLFTVLGMLDKTPRKKYNRWMTLKGLGWGSIYPKFTLLGVIAITYSCIAPLLLGFATIGFTLLYIGFRYNFLFVFGVQVDMKGEGYSRALKQVMTGVYLSTLCLIGLFAIKTADQRAAVGPLVLMIIFLVVLIAWQFLTDRAFAPLEQVIPVYRLEANPHSLTEAHQVEAADKEGISDMGGTSGLHGSTDDPKAVHEKQEYEQANSNATGNFLTRWSNPYIDRSFKSNKELLDNWSRTFDDPERYTAEDLDVAYLNPALSAETKPTIWLPRDNLGVSERLVKENRQAGLHSSDEFAWLNVKGKVEWANDRVTDVPIYEEEKLW